MRSSRPIVSLVVLLALCAQGVHGATYYLDQASGNDDNDGTSLGTAFKTPDKATGALKAGDELRIVGTLTNPSYNSTYSFTSASDPHLWHGETTLLVKEVHGDADNWITITSHDSSTVLKGDGGNIIRVQDSSYVRLRNLDVHGEVDNIPLATAKAVQFVYKDNDVIKYRVPENIWDDPEKVYAESLSKLGSNVPRVSYTDTRGVWVKDSHHQSRCSAIHCSRTVGGSWWPTISRTGMDSAAFTVRTGTILTFSATPRT